MSLPLPVLVALLLAISLISAQEFGTAPVGRPTPATIFDEITNARERSAFHEVWDATDPRKQRDLAIRFVDRYPRSIVLKDAYELAARASLPPIIPVPLERT